MSVVVEPDANKVVRSIWYTVHRFKRYINITRRKFNACNPVLLFGLEKNNIIVKII